MVTQNDLLYSIESSATLMSRYPQISVNNKPHTRQMLQAQRIVGAQPISQLLDPQQNVVGHGAFTFENTLGGRVAVVPWDASVSETPMMDIHRAEQLRSLIRWLARNLETGSVEGGAWLIPQFLVPPLPLGEGLGVRAGSPLPLGEGLGVRAWRGVIWNASPDEIESFTIHRPQGMSQIHEAWHLLPSGKRLPAQIHNDQITLTHPMHQWECVVLTN
jgi:hypothetical protein